MKILNVAIFGTGWAAEAHFKTIKRMNKFKVCCVFGRNKERLKTIRKKWNVTIYNSKKELFLNEKIDVVLVANQNSFHYQDAFYALKKGINVVLEKPTSTSFYNSKKLVDYALKKKLKISVVMQRRFDASSDYLKYLIQKKIGKIILIKLNIFMHRDHKYFDKLKWLKEKKKSGGGILIHHAIHSIDQLLYVLNQKVIDAKCHISNKILKLKIEDTAVGFIVFKNQKIASLSATYCANKNLKNSIEIYGDKLSVKLENNKIYNLSKRYNKKDYVLKSFAKASLGNYQSIWEDFYIAEKSRVSIDRILETDKAISLMYKSFLFKI